MKRRRLASLLTVCVAIGNMCITSPAIADNEIITIGGTSAYNTAIANGQNTPQVLLEPGAIAKNWNTIELQAGGTLNIEGYNTDAITNGILDAQNGNVNLTNGNLTIDTGSAIMNAVALETSPNTTLNITGGTVNLNEGDFIYGSINAQTGKLNINDDTTISQSFDNAITLTNDKVLTVGATLTNSGTIANSLEITANVLKNTGIIDGVPDPDDSESINYGNLIVNNGGSSSGTIEQGDITISGTFKNTGEITSVGTFTNNGAITNNAGEGALIIADGENNSLIEQSQLIITYNNNNKLFTNRSDIKVEELTNYGAFTNSADNNGGRIEATKITNYAIGTVGDKDFTFTNDGEIVSLDSKGLEINNKGVFDNTSTGKIIADTINNEVNSLNGIVGAFTNEEGEVIVNLLLKNDAAIANTGNITTEVLTNTGIISGLTEFDENNNLITTKYGDLTIKNGGSSTGIIEQKNITISGVFKNSGNMTAKEEFTNNGIFTNNKIVVAKNFINNDKVYNNNILVARNNEHTGTITNKGTINSIGNETPAIIDVDKLNNNGEITLKNSILNVVWQSDELGGTINVKGSNPLKDTSVLIIDNDGNLNTSIEDVPNFVGTLNVGELGNSEQKSTLLFMNGKIAENAQVNIAKGNTFFVFGKRINQVDADPKYTAELSINGEDNIEGNLLLGQGEINLSGVHLSTGAIPTTQGGEKPFYRQVVGKLSIKDSNLTMDNAALISGGDLIIDKTSTFTSKSNGFKVNNLSTSGTIKSINGGIENYTVNDKFIIGDKNGSNEADFEVDLYARSNNNKGHDSYGSDTAIILAANDDQEATLNITDWKLGGDIYGWDAPIDRHILMDNIFKGEIQDGTCFSVVDKEIFTPIGWYTLSSTGTGDYTFDLTRFNPGVYRGQISTLAQYQNQLVINDMIFNHTMLDQGFKGNDYISSNPNRYASANDLYPPYQYSRKDGGLWVKMYGNFEKLQMSQGLNVGNNAYGTIIGADFGLKDLKKGWQFMPTAYIAYNGGHQYWNGYGAYQNGGQAGFLGTWYKNDFMIGAMAYGGVYGNQMDTPRGTDDAFNYFAGASTRTAYNWRFAKNWALQPNLLLSYNYFGQQNWHSDFGQMGMMSGMLHGINIAPGLNLIYERETFSIYATMQYMYNINQSVGGRAGNVDLPSLSMNRGYMQYGIGINKKFTDRFSGYFQGVLRNVGRNGIGLQMGFNYTLGKEPKYTTSEKEGITPVLSPTKIELKSSKR